MSKWTQWVVTTLFFWILFFVLAYKQIPIKSKKGLIFWVLYTIYLLLFAAVVVNLPESLIGLVFGLALAYSCILIMRAGEKYVKSDEK